MEISGMLSQKWLPTSSQSMWHAHVCSSMHTFRSDLSMHCISLACDSQRYVTFSNIDSDFLNLCLQFSYFSSAQLTTMEFYYVNTQRNNVIQ